MLAEGRTPGRAHKQFPFFVPKVGWLICLLAMVLKFQHKAFGLGCTIIKTQQDATNSSIWRNQQADECFATVHFQDQQDEGE